MKRLPSIRRYFTLYEILIFTFLCFSFILISIFTTRAFTRDLYLKETRNFSLRIRDIILRVMESNEKEKFEHVKRLLPAEGKFLRNMSLYTTDEGMKIQEKIKRTSCRGKEVCIETGKDSIGFLYAIRNEGNCRKCHLEEKETLLFIEMEVDTSDLISTLKKLTFLLLGVGAIFLLILIGGSSLIFSSVIQKPFNRIMMGIKEYEGGKKAREIDFGEAKSDEFKLLSEELLRLFLRLEIAMKELDEFYQQKMQRADRLATLGELASTLAHEIKNPLAGISGVIQVLLKEREIPERTREMLKEILNLTGRLDRTVRNLLSFAKDTPPDFRPAHINEAIRKTLLIIEQQAMMKNVLIQIQLERDIPSTLMDEEQIQHLLINLIMNSIQSMPDGGKISIKTSLVKKEEKEYIKVSVSDTGTGISPEIMPRIFDPFFTTRPQGTGLGLYICRRIIKSHDGEIWVESEPGKGSVFHFTIPVRNIPG